MIAALESAQKDFFAGSDVFALQCFHALELGLVDHDSDCDLLRGRSTLGALFAAAGFLVHDMVPPKCFIGSLPPEHTDAERAGS